jgi:hypothetical protein
MPDWKQIVRDRLQPTGLDLSDSVISELAAHLEETCEAESSRGTSAPAALGQALQEVNNWHVLARNIQRAKSKEEFMNHRTKSLWLPAMAGILGASLAMTLLQWMGVRPHLVSTKDVGFSFYWPWLASLPAFGALAAYLSRRSGGSIRSRLTAALAPVLWLLLPSFLIEPVEIMHRGLWHLRYFSYGMINWVVIPGIALLLGAAPLLKEEKLQKGAPV